MDCGAACTARCQLSSRQKLCKRACGTYCARCNCVPPGTSGNHELVPEIFCCKYHGGVQGFKTEYDVIYMLDKITFLKPHGLAQRLDPFSPETDGVSPQGVTSGSNPSFVIGDPMKKLLSNSPATSPRMVVQATTSPAMNEPADPVLMPIIASPTMAA
ncbi:hypothetical protein RJ639_002590 [Escallonia herrerae]|uniref:Uncharacterized protein n=1 Tax=Escallonia herrerae TaxID=1293975 RepID=A0AA89BNB6_9ASTE|nr:hypothetical protein RJ639_002590 [Escallonia herrerae]